MKLIGNINGTLLIFDPNIGMNSYRAGKNSSSYFNVTNNFSSNHPVSPTELYQTIRLRQQTTSSRLLVPVDTNPTEIDWISSGSDNIENFHMAYRDYMSKTNS